MVVLAMDVIGYCASHRYKLGSGSDRKEPSLRNGQLEQLVQGHPSFAAQHPSLFIEGYKPAEARRVKQKTFLVKAAVAIASTLTIRQDQLLERPKVRQFMSPVNRNHSE